MRFTKSLLYKTSILSLCVMLTACGKKSKDDDDDEEAAGGSPTSNSTNPAATEKTTELTSAASVMTAIGGALASIPGTLVLGSGLALDSSASGDTNCSEHGEPLKVGFSKAKGEPIVDGDYLSRDDADYPSKLFVCLATLTADKGASVETLQGYIAQVGSIFCSVEKALGTIEYTAEGNQMISGAAVDVALSADCWPQGAPDGMTSVPFNSAIATALDASTGYEKELSFVSEEAGVEETLRFFNKDGVIGFKKQEKGEAPGVGGYSEMVMNTNTGVILVNVVDDRNGYGGADSKYRRVVRMKVNGALDGDLKFTSLAAMQGIRANSGNYDEDEDQFTGATINGDADKGYYGQSVYVYDGAISEQNKYAGCTGSATCTAEGLLFTADNFSFYNSRAAWTTHRDSGLPPCDNGASIDFGAVPATGAFGICE